MFIKFDPFSLFGLSNDPRAYSILYLKLFLFLSELLLLVWSEFFFFVIYFLDQDNFY